MLETVEVLRLFLFSLIIGIFIGGEREYSKWKYKVHTFGGIRTSILISILGALSGYFTIHFKNLFFWFVPFVVVSAFVLINYVMTIKRYKEIHTTTGISAILIFILSSIVFFGFDKIALALGILIAVLLAFKIYLHTFIKKITKKELHDTLKFAIISLVILPFLPNKAYGPLAVLNPYHIWLMVVFISAISFIGYILVKLIGANRGIGITGFVGGLVSSTAVAMTFSEKSKKSSRKLTNAFALAIVLASTTMFLRVLFEILVVNRSLLDNLIIPLGLMSLGGFAFSYFFYKTKKSGKGQKLDLKSPFTLKPALKFGIFFAFILLLSKAAQMYLGNTGVYITSIISGLADVDAITLSMASFASNNIVTEKVATSAITLAVLTNNVVKGGISYIWGSKELKKKIALTYLAITIIGILSIFLL
jgi:uncharacterized membrane protein (DUF4010 family)